MVNEIKRYDIFLINLDPTIGHEIKKSRPCIIISPNEMNMLKTVIIAPMTTKIREFPFRVNVEFEKKKGQVALDQLRCIDKIRLIKKIGIINQKFKEKISNKLVTIFKK